jgi:hypothetical protein
MCPSDVMAEIFYSKIRGGIRFWTVSRFPTSIISTFYLFSIKSVADVFKSSEE